MEEIIAWIKKAIKDGGCRFTAQRLAVARVFCENRGAHLTAEEIYASAKRLYPGISLATVYKTAQQFEKLGLALRINVLGVGRYQLALPGEKRHRHFVCRGCGRVIDIDREIFADSETRFEQKYGVEIEENNSLYSGLCADCLGSSKLKA